MLLLFLVLLITIGVICWYVFKKEEKLMLVTSKFLGADFYIGKMLKLDASLKYLVGSNVLFESPQNTLIIEKFQYFDIDDNPFEAVVFEKQNNTRYKTLYDTSTETMFFLNLVHTEPVSGGKNDQEPMLTHDSIELTEGQYKYQYDDFSGLIEITVTDNSKVTQALIRVYRREVQANEYEYLVCELRGQNQLEYYVGFEISKLQLENI